jgi:hypothetical protein
VILGITKQLLYITKKMAEQSVKQLLYRTYIKKWQSSFVSAKTALPFLIQRLVHFTPIYEWEGKYKNGRAALTETKLQYNVWCTLPRYTNGRENMVCFQFNIVKRK